MSTNDSAWNQVDDFYWAGPPGWTICKVFSRRKYRYELWRQVDGNATLVGSYDELALAMASARDTEPAEL